MDYTVVTLPPSYSEAHQRQREAIIRHMDDLRREMIERARPLEQMLADIEACYAPRMVLVPAAPTDTSEG